MDEFRLLIGKKKKENLGAEDNEKLELIEFLAKSDAMFLSLSKETAYGILNFLGVKEDKLNDYYLSLCNYIELHEETEDKDISPNPEIITAGKNIIEKYYLDDDHNFVNKNVATQLIIRETDESGTLIRETFCVLKPEVPELSSEDLELIKEFEEKYSGNLVSLQNDKSGNIEYFSVKNGLYYFKVENNRLFYLLNDEFEWVFCPALRDVYFDAGSDCIEVSEEFIERHISANN